MKYITPVLSLLALCTLLLPVHLAAQNTVPGIAPSNKPLFEMIQERTGKNIPFKKLDWFSIEPAPQRNRFKQQVSAATILRLDREQLKQFLKKPTTDIEFQVPSGSGQKLTLLLSKAQIVSDGFDVTTASGKSTLLHLPGLFYHGIVEGERSSICSVSMFGDHVRILIANARGNQMIQQYEASGRDDLYIMYNDRELSRSLNDYCKTPEQAHSHRLSPSQLNPAAASNCIKMYLECDFALYEDNNSELINTVEYALELFSESQLIFRNENIKIELSKIFVWDEEDPYATTDCGDILDAFVANRPVFDGDLAHLISSKFTSNSENSVSFCGKAYGIGGICGDDSAPGPYCVSLGLLNPVPDFPVYSWELNVFTHEIGHVLGSRHTHACVWNGDGTQIDDCGNQTAFDDGNTPEGDGCFDDDNPILPVSGGFIMSYCHQLNTIGMNFSLGFGLQSGNIIRSTIMGGGCLSETCSCEDFTDRTVNGSPILPAVYNANNSIISAGQATTPDANVIFQAGSRITLEEGFIGEELFLAQIVDTLCESGSSSALAGTSFAYDWPAAARSTVPTGLQLEVWPNPASAEVQLEYRLEKEQTVHIELLDLYGRPAIQQLSYTYQSAGIQRENLSVGHLPAGLYQLVLRYGDRYITKPLIIETL